MAKFLISVWPWPGHYFPLTAIAHQLRARGHAVAFYTSARVCGTLGAEGFECFPFEQIDEGKFAALERRNDFASVVNPSATREFMRGWLLDTLPGQVADISQIVERWQPDVVVTETGMWGPTVVVHEAFHIPVAVFSTVISCLLPGPDAPPFGLGLPRPKSAKDRLIATSLRSLGRMLQHEFKSGVNALRSRYGLSAIDVSPTEYCGRMPLYLMPSVPEFDYQRKDLPPSVRYIGPCVWNKPSLEPPPQWLSELQHDRPLVHVSEGTVNSQRPVVLRAAARGLADLSLDVVMTAGGNRDVETLELGTLPANVRVVRWVAHSDLLPHTDVLVTTGGAGTIMTALQAGVPLVVVPTEWEKPDNAQRVVESGVGVRLSPRRCTPERLRAAVLDVLNKQSYRENAARFQNLLLGYDGPAYAAELLETLIQSPARPQLYAEFAETIAHSPSM